MSAAPALKVEPDSSATTAASDPPQPAVPVRRRSEPPVEEGAPTWMVTFGDLMSLLLTFFILLFSMSEIEVEKFRQAAKSLHEGFGSSVVDMSLNEDLAVSDAADSVVVSTIDPADVELDRIANILEEFAEENGLETSLLVDRTDEGVYLRIKDAVLFQPGFAEVEEQSIWIVEKLSHLTLEIDIPVTVAGHTDDIPISSPRYKSNWELSAARAAGVARALVDLGHDAAEIQVTAFGEYRPIDTNETAEGRARNRRVELFYSKQSATEALQAADADSTATETEPPADSLQT